MGSVFMISKLISCIYHFWTNVLLRYTQACLKKTICHLHMSLKRSLSSVINMEHIHILWQLMSQSLTFDTHTQREQDTHNISSVNLCLAKNSHYTRILSYLSVFFVVLAVLCENVCPKSEMRGGDQMCGHNTTISNFTKKYAHIL